MRSIKNTQASYRATPLLVFLSILPVIAYVLLSYLGLMSMAKVAAMGVFAALLGLTCFSRPRWGIYFIVFYIYAGLSFYLPGPTAAGVMLILAAALLADALRGESILLPEPVFLWSVSLFVLAAMGSILWAHSYDLAIGGSSRILKALLVVFLLVHFIRTPEKLLKFGFWIFVGGVATVILGIINMKLGIDKSFDPHGGIAVQRFSGAHKNSNYAATYMLSTLPIGVFIIRYVKSWFLKMLAVTGVIVVITGSFATLSRSSIFAFVAIMMGVLLKEARNWKVYLLLIVPIAAGLLLTPRYYWMRLWEMTALLEDVRQDYSIYTRVMVLRQSWELFLEHPLTGIGLNNFFARSGTDVFKRIGVHNAYLEVLCGVGIFGMIAYLAVICSALRQFYLGFRAQWPEPYVWMKHLSYYMMLGFVAVLVRMVFSDIHFNYVLWVPIAGALVIGTVRRRECRLPS